MTINLEILREAIADYLNAEEEYRMFLKTWKLGSWLNKTAQEREDYTKYEERAFEKYKTVEMMCMMIEIDEQAFITIVKAILRWEKNHGKYDRNIHLNDLNNFKIKHWIQTITNDWKAKINQEHYKSTGRRIRA